MDAFTVPIANGFGLEKVMQRRISYVARALQEFNLRPP